MRDANIVQEVAAAFRDRIDRGAYTITHGSTWPSELVALVATAREHGVKLMLEGGTFFGQSAWAFATFIPATVVTYEIDPEVAQRARDRLVNSPVEVIAGDAYAMLAPKAAELSTPFGVFLDGPKGTPALILVQSLMEDTRLTNLKFIAVHDTYASTMGRPNPARAGLIELGDYTEGWTRWSTDDPEWAATGVRALDEGLYHLHRREPHGWEPFTQYIHGQPHRRPSYGPTAMFLERT